MQPKQAGTSGEQCETRMSLYLSLFAPNRRANPETGMFATDQQLIAKVVSGNPQARAQFVERYGPDIWGMVLKSSRLSANDSQAGEIFSDVCTKLIDQNFRAVRQWRGEGDFRAFLSIIVLNCCRDHFRRRQVQQRHTPISLGPAEDGGQDWEFDPPCEDPDPLEALLAKECRSERQEAVRVALPRLTPRDREIIQRRHFQEESYKEIAAGMELSVNQVGVYLGRAEKRLAKFLAALLGHDAVQSLKTAPNLRSQLSRSASSGRKGNRSRISRKPPDQAVMPAPMDRLTLTGLESEPAE
jgi:RNA polymerase sigma factor (sigma-70 family)